MIFGEDYLNKVVSVSEKPKETTQLIIQTANIGFLLSIGDEFGQETIQVTRDFLLELKRQLSYMNI